MGLKDPKQSGSRLRAAIIFTVVVLFAARPTAAAEGQGGRLGHAIVPVFESVRLVVDPAAPSYHGSAHVELKGIDLAASFTFHARDLVIGGLTLQGNGGRIPVEHVVEGDVVRVTSSRGSGITKLTGIFTRDARRRLNCRFAKALTDASSKSL